ncbi:hypothetical protein DL93DRAFT_2165525 [Clavulina sp. PMI_390]|nr:hypothetical protein DL93DRAFT_2165525 [Clavulina sp. PMI_390]
MIRTSRLPSQTRSLVRLASNFAASSAGHTTASTTTSTPESSSRSRTQKPPRHHGTKRYVNPNPPLYTEERYIRPTRATPTSSSTLDQQIHAYVKTAHPTRRARLARQLTIESLERLIRKDFGPRYSIQPFGSTVYGVDVSNSDLDLILVTFLGPNDLRAVADSMWAAGFTAVKFIPANFPIISARHRKTGIKLDLNFNDRLALNNTLLIKRYSELAPVLIPLLYFVKLWAKAHGLNSPALGGRDRSFSSYCYALMAVGYLQHIGALPNLQSEFANLAVNDRQGFWLRDKRNTARVFCDIRFSKDPPATWTPSVNMPSASDTIKGWFRYWGIQHDYETTKMSIRYGGPLSREGSFAEPDPKQSKPPEIPPRSDGRLFSYSLDEAGLQAFLAEPDPERWNDNLLVVEDPFIRSKVPLFLLSVIEGSNLTDATSECWRKREQRSNQTVEIVMSRDE